MKFINALVMIIGFMTGLIRADLNHYCSEKEYKQMAAAFYKNLMNERPSMVSLLRVIRDQGIVAEQALGIMDKDLKCKVSHDDIIAFLEKWAKKKHQKLSEKSRKFADTAFNFIDDNHDGFIDQYELNYAMTVIAK